MTKPRRQLICYSDTLYYSITSRCVRSAFLCGEDPLTQKSYEHRRKWIEDRIRVLSSLFSLEIMSYVIMSNHFHIILKAIPDEAAGWNDKEVVRRWLSIYRGPLIANRYLKRQRGHALSFDTLTLLDVLCLKPRSRMNSMTKPRRQLICYSDTLYYSITSRCVRRAFLCGEDPLTQKSYEHRRKWIEDRIRVLSSLFSLEIMSYVIMSNHFHIILKAIPDEAADWNDKEVVRRWLSIYRGPLIANRYLKGADLSKAEKEMLLSFVKCWRERLSSISWFMKCLNEPIARQANKEDDCTGHFWQARFDSRGLFSEEAILTAMAYVDLNPVRASIAETLEQSEFTSIKERISPSFNLATAVKSYCEHGGFSHQLLDETNPIAVRPLAEFIGGETLKNQDSGIHFNFIDYLELIDFTGRAIVQHKPGYIDNRLLGILFRLSIKPKTWFENILNFEALYYKRFAPRFLLTG